MADYSRPGPSEDEVLAGRERARRQEAEEWRVGFQAIKGAITADGQAVQCLGCGCLVADRDVHREKCA